jgi:hypothetical protein
MGREHSEETRSKIGLANTGKVRAEETIVKLRLSHLGEKHSAETITKRIASLKLAWTPEMRARKSEVTRAIWAGRRAQKEI